MECIIRFILITKIRDISAKFHITPPKHVWSHKTHTCLVCSPKLIYWTNTRIDVECLNLKCDFPMVVFFCAPNYYIFEKCVCVVHAWWSPSCLLKKKHISVTAGPADGGAGDEQSTTAAASGIGRSLSVCAWIRELRKLWGSVLLLYVVDQVYYTVYGIEGDGKIRQLADWSIKCWPNWFGCVVVVLLWLSAIRKTKTIISISLKHPAIGGLSAQRSSDHWNVASFNKLPHIIGLTNYIAVRIQH